MNDVAKKKTCLSFLLVFHSLLGLSRITIQESDSNIYYYTSFNRNSGKES